ncbi:MAG: sulfatase-like hydrolase/transferase [Acidimicrobiia bacterium]|nr:sulfatase-like hydrolase/transferase [Acidimicrobiia bacterium]
MPSPSRPPNVVILMTDEERAPTHDEPAALQAFRRSHMPARQWLVDHGTAFERHYAASTACQPSRGSFFTGHYPSLHGVTQTSGTAKLHGDPRLRPLDPAAVPTMGHWFRAAGYETVYKGKWHISEEDILDADGDVRHIAAVDGTIDTALAREYERAELLDKFGFAGWRGPEPHGAAPEESGAVRDALLAADVVQWLERRREASAAAAPYLLVASFVNPHDICLWPARALLGQGGGIAEDVPAIGAFANDSDDLVGKPLAVRAYREAYRTMYGPAWLIDTVYDDFVEQYRRYYFSLLADVDRELARVLDTLRSMPDFDRTIVVFTSDHGDLLGAHGGLHQKWFNMYDESVRVPFVVVDGREPGVPRGIASVTSHVDVLPTLLGLAGIDTDAVLDDLRGGFTDARPLVGRDLSAALAGEDDTGTGTAYFMTEDRVMEGSSQIGAIAMAAPPALGRILDLEYDSVRDCAASVEGVVTTRADGTTWKYVRFFDDPGLWSHPDKYDEYTFRSGDRAGTTSRRDWVLPEEAELYCLDDDPAEMVNRVGDPECTAVLAEMRALLDAERKAKRLAPNHPRPYASVDAGASAKRGIRLDNPPGFVRRATRRLVRRNVGTRA